MAVSTASLLFTGGLGATAASLGTFKVIVGGLVYAGVSTVVASALSPKPKMPSIGGNIGVSVDPIGASEIIYGQIRKGGVKTYHETTGDGTYYHYILTLAMHEVEEIGTIYVNDDAVTLDNDGYVTSDGWNSKILVKKFTGTSTQNIYQQLNPLPNGPENIGTTFHGKGVACIYVRLQWDKDVFQSGQPLVTAVVKGKKVYDPRKDSTSSAYDSSLGVTSHRTNDASTWEYSSNPALAMRDYLTSTQGVAADHSQIDDDMIATAADDCANTGVANAEENSFEIGGSITTGDSKLNNLNNLIKCLNGTLFWAQGKFRLVAGAYHAPTISDAFTLDDVRGPISIQTRHSRRDLVNTVRGTFVDKDERWIATDFPTVQLADMSEDNDVESVIDVDLPLVTKSAAAQRLAKQILYTSREQITLSAKFSAKAYQVQVGDTIKLTMSRYGWTNKVFLVKGWKATGGDGSPIEVELTLQETSSTAYEWSVSADEYAAITANNTSLDDIANSLTIGTIQNTQETSLQPDGTVVAKAALSWTAPSNGQIVSYDVEWKASGDSFYSKASTDTSNILLTNLISGLSYTVRVYAVTARGNRSNSTNRGSLTFTAAGDTTAPATPAARSPALKVGGYRTATIGWTAPSDDDLKGYKVYRNTSNSQPENEIALTADTQYTDSGLDDATTYYYWVEAFDNSGNDSSALSIGSLTTLDELVDGESGLTLVMSNENHTFAANSSGTVSSYAYSGTTIRLFEGSTELAYNGLGTTNGTWKIGTSATSITRGTITDSGDYVTIGSHSNMTADTATIQYTITGKRANGDAISLTKSQSFTKAKDGATGAAGQDAMAYAVLARDDAYGPSSGTSKDLDPMSTGQGDYFLMSTTGTVTLDNPNDDIDSTSTMTFANGNVNTKNYIGILSPDENDANSATALSSLDTVRANLSQIAYNIGNDKAVYDVVQVYTPIDVNGDTLYLFKVDHVSGDFTMASPAGGTNVTFEINYQLKGNSGVDGARGAGRWNVLMPSVAATSLVANKRYLITSVGTTNFSSIDSNSPACQNIVGAEFLASGAGTGTGTAVEKIDSSSDADTLFTSVIGNPVDDDQAFFFSGTQSSPDNITVWIYDESSDTWTEQTEFIDGDLLVTGTVTTSKLDANAVTADKIQAGEVNASKLTIDDELILQNDAGFIAGRNFNSDYATSGFFVGRETRADGTQGFELSSSSTDSNNRITGLLHNEQDHLQLLNPIMRFGGSATGASTNYTTTQTVNLGINTGRTITITALGGGGGGGGGHENRGDNSGGTGDPGGTTTVVLRDGSASGPEIKTITSAGGNGGQSGGGARGGHGTNGGSTAFGTGGTGGGENTAGSNAPSTSYGAGGGGGGGDDSSLFDNSGAAGLGGDAAIATVENVSITSSNDIFAVITIGGGGDGDTDGISHAGGNGADGVAAITSVLGGMNEYESEFIDNILKYTTIGVPTTSVSSNMDTNNVNTYPTGNQAPARVDQDADDGTLIIFEDIYSSETNGDVYFQFNGGVHRGQGTFLSHINDYGDGDGERTFSLRNYNATVTELGKLIHTGGSFDSSSNKITINTNEHLCEWMFQWNGESKTSFAQTVETAANYQVANGVSDNYWSLRTFTKFATWTNSTDLAPSSSTTWSDLEGNLFRMDPTGGIDRKQIDNLNGAIGNNDYKITLENTTLSGTNSAQFTVLDAYAGNSNTDIVIHLGKVSNASGKPYGASTDDMSLTMPAFDAQTKRTFYIFEHTNFTYLLRPQDITRDEENGTWQFDTTEVALVSGTAPSTDATYSSSAFTLQNAGTTWSDETWGLNTGGHRINLTINFQTRSGLQYIYLPAGGWMSSDRNLYIGGTSGKYVTYENVSVDRAKELIALWKKLLGVTTTTWGDHL